MSQIPFIFSKETIQYNNGEVLYLPNFFERDYFDQLKNLNWRSDKITLFGKTHPIPRLHCWYADLGTLYEYSKISLTQNVWTRELLEIKNLIEDYSQVEFNGMLGNYYRDGRDYVSWHSDDEDSLGCSPIIGCASFGESRVFSLRSKLSGEVIRINLEDRSLLLMYPPTQRDWEHQINKSSATKDERISLTFRFVHQ